MPNSKESKNQEENFRERTERGHAPHSIATGQSQCEQNFDKPNTYENKIAH
jgi:hypothetical protein